MNTDDMEKKFKKFVLNNKKILLVTSLFVLVFLLIFGAYLYVFKRIESHVDKNKVDYSKIVDKDDETQKKLLDFFSEENEIELEAPKEKDTVDLNLKDYMQVQEDEQQQNLEQKQKIEPKNHPKKNQNKNATIYQTTPKEKKDTNNQTSYSYSNSVNDVNGEYNKYSLSFDDEKNESASSTATGLQKEAKLLVMESKKYKNHELIRLRFLDDFENYKKNQNIYGRITFSNDRAKIYIEENKNLYLYSKDGLEGIKIGVDIKDLKAKNQATSSSIDAIGNIIGNSVRSVDPTLGLLTQASNTAISTGRVYLQDNEILINIDEGTYLYVKRPK